METHVRDGLEYWIAIPAKWEKALYELRSWSHLKMAQEQRLIWIRGFSKTEIEATKVLSIPAITRYYLQGAQLFLVGHRLPTRIEPSLLWTPIERALRVELPSQNFNYFGLHQKHRLSLIPSTQEMPVTATMVDLEILENYLFKAPNIRLKNLHWTIVNKQKALVIGTPILPLNSEDYYQLACFLIPAGWMLKYEHLAKVYESALGESTSFWYWLLPERGILKIRRADFAPLNKGSFKKTLAKLNR